MTQGFFIVFEGGDGSGKSTQLGMLADRLRAFGRDVVRTREPGGTLMGRQIRQLLLHSEEVGPKAEALLFAADRAHHVDSLVRPALARGAVVLSDRFMDSSIAYQGQGRDLGVEEVRELSLWATTRLLPDITVILDLDPNIAAKRLGDHLDRMESAGITFHTQVRQRFLDMAAEGGDSYLVVDASKPAEVIAQEIWQHVWPRVNNGTKDDLDG
ncbi:MAG: dTMP kinase [Actinomycetaceae bacterium]|nr:dTMP kinase [Actinomycetaceae bacterium]